MTWESSYESMLDSVLVARDRFLRPGGLIVPSQCSILLSAVSCPSFLSSEVTFWDDVYGFKMSAMKEESSLGLDTEVLVLPGDNVVSTTCGLKDVFMQKDSVKDTDKGFVTDFELKVTAPGSTMVHGFLGWFDTYFTKDGRDVPSLSLAKDLGDLDTSEQGGEIQFTTGPHGTETHWKQSLFLLKDGGVRVEEGEVLRGSFRCTKRREENSRELVVEMVWRKEGERDDRIQVWNVR